MAGDLKDVNPYLGQRLSLKKQTCTVRYIGSVADKQGSWLGVEWDDPSRGKHNGTHDGVSYFTCRSNSSTAASFLRPKQSWDESRTFLQALREKYISPEDATNAEIVYISGKHAEEVGLEKFAKRQAQLQGIHTLVLDRMCLRHSGKDQESDRSVSETCANITSLDVGGNLFETWDEIMNLVRLFPRLSSLTLDGNRFSVDPMVESTAAQSSLRYLSLNETLLTPPEIATATTQCPSIQTLTLANNSLTDWYPNQKLPQTLTTLDLSNNSIPSLQSIAPLLALPNLQTLLLKHNKIGTHPLPTNPLSPTLHTLDLRSNAITTWSFYTNLHPTLPSLRNLLTASNPLYDNIPASDAYTLTLARLPHLHALNHSAVTDKERLNAETYYLGQIARELARASTPAEREEVLGAHPRWAELCESYGEPVTAAAPGADDVDPASLAARLVRVRFCLSEEACAALGRVGVGAWEEDVPRSASVYALLGRVGRRVGVMPLRVRLVWETGERDPVTAGEVGGEGLEWWDSEDEEGEGNEEQGWAEREVKLVPGTRMVGTYFEGKEARVRVEVK